MISLHPASTALHACGVDDDIGPQSQSCSRRGSLPSNATGSLLASSEADEWTERIAAQQRSGISVKQFCKDQGLTEYSFYAWRKRLQKKEPVHFALVDRGAARQEQATDAALELVLATGERLRIGAGVDAATLRTVLEALRA
jgi:hypothetical protein